MIAAGTSPARPGDELVRSYARVRLSVAIVATLKAGNDLTSATAFCIFSDAHRSVFVTSRHVVRGIEAMGIVTASPRRAFRTVRILRVGTDADVALIEVPAGNIPVLTLADHAPPPGTAIAVTGFPVSQLTFSRRGLGLSPSVHAGTVNALLSKRRVIIYDAQSQEGNSGSPVFDPVTGLVYGVASEKFDADQTNVAVSAEIVRSIARNAHVAIPAAGALRPPPYTASPGAATSAAP
jgi:S1-C subfamily serine protease